MSKYQCKAEYPEAWVTITAYKPTKANSRLFPKAGLLGQASSLNVSTLLHHMDGAHECIFINSKCV